MHPRTAWWCTRSSRSLIGGLLAVLCAPPASAQGWADEPTLPRAVVSDVLQRWNTPGTQRVLGAFTVAASDTVRGDYAVLNGPVQVAGVLAGRLLVVNGTLSFAPGAVITGDVLLVGGTVGDRRGVRLDGELRAWRESLAVRVVGESLSVAPDSSARSSWERWRRREEVRRISDFFVASAHTYNRVEGLPIVLGPRLQAPLGGSGRLQLDVLGIVRTGDRLEWTPENRGHLVRGRISRGSRMSMALAGQLYDEVAAIEPWTLRDTERGLATALFTRDYADFYGRKGASIGAELSLPGGVGVSVTHADERWRSRAARDVWSLLDRDRPFRANPRVDEGRLHLTTVALTMDTRNDRTHPRDGWSIRLEHESGVGTLDVLAPTALDVRPAARAGRVRYGRFFGDVRRYLRLAPNAQLNARLVVGSGTGGTLPLARRFSVSGIDALPGFTFRTPIGAADLGMCSDGRTAIAGTPAQCDGMALAQLEWRGEFSRGFPDRWPHSDWIDFRGVRGAWVLFVNSGRGWLRGAAPAPSTVGAANAVGTARFLDGGLPSLGSFRTDVGVGVDLDFIGVYLAAPVSTPGAGRAPTVFLRTGRRF